MVPAASLDFSSVITCNHIESDYTRIVMAVKCGDIVELADGRVRIVWAIHADGNNVYIDLGSGMWVFSDEITIIEIES